MTGPVLRVPDTRFLSQERCAALAKRVAGMAVGGGHTQTVIDSSWTGNVRWARNQIATGGDVRNNAVTVMRQIRGAGTPYTAVDVNQIDDAVLEGAVRRAERLLQLSPETQQSAHEVEITEQYLRPTIWSDATYTLDAEARADVARSLLAAVERGGMVAAGYIEVSAHGRAIMSSRGRTMYYPYTEAQYSVTVRDPKGQGSGWAGVSHYDWTQIDAAAITRRALEKCVASRNPVALEPGRYTTIMEPQAVCDLLVGLLGRGFDRMMAEADPGPGDTPFWKEPNQSKLGEIVLDERLTVNSDPLDPELGVPPFAWGFSGFRGEPAVEVYHPAVWIKQGVLTNLAYDRDYAVQRLGKDNGLPMTGSFRLAANTPPTSMDEMIATTTRGLVVTRFDSGGSPGSGTGGGGVAAMCTGYTRDGVWLIENGKISKPVKNFRFVDSSYFILQPSRLEQIGAPARVFHPGSPVMVPPLKVKDFNFTQLADAI